MSAIAWGSQQFTPLLLVYKDLLHLSATDVQATFLPYVFGLMPGLLFGGPCSDRFGRRWPVLIGFGVFFAGSLWCALATDLPSLLVTVAPGAGQGLNAVGPRGGVA